jgi:hypothetical protein
MAADVRFMLSAGPAAPGEARRRIAVLDQLAPAAVADVQLVANELIISCLLRPDPAPGRRLEVALRITEEHLVIEVDDRGPTAGGEPSRPPAPEGASLRILEGICEHWDTQQGRVVARINLSRYGTR